MEYKFKNSILSSIVGINDYIEKSMIANAIIERIYLCNDEAFFIFRGVYERPRKKLIELRNKAIEAVELMAWSTKKNYFNGHLVYGVTEMDISTLQGLLVGEVSMMSTYRNSSQVGKGLIRIIKICQQMIGLYNTLEACSNGNADDFLKKFDEITEQTGNAKYTKECLDRAIHSSECYGFKIGDAK